MIIITNNNNTKLLHKPNCAFRVLLETILLVVDNVAGEIVLDDE